MVKCKYKVIGHCNNLSPHGSIAGTVSMLSIQSMCSAVPRYILVAVMLGLFPGLMKFTVVNESLSINKPNVLY